MFARKTNIWLPEPWFGFLQVISLLAASQQQQQLQHLLQQQWQHEEREFFCQSMFSFSGGQKKNTKDNFRYFFLQKKVFNEDRLLMSTHVRFFFLLPFSTFLSFYHHHHHCRRHHRCRRRQRTWGESQGGADNVDVDQRHWRCGHLDNFNLKWMETLSGFFCCFHSLVFVSFLRLFLSLLLFLIIVYLTCPLPILWFYFTSLF